MRMHTFLTLAAVTVVFANDVRSGCGVSFNYAFVNGNGEIVQNWVQVPFMSHLDTADVHVPNGLFLKATPSWATCVTTEGRLWRNGELIQEWPSNAGHWTALTHGLYKWQVEGHGNMGTGPVIHHYRILGPLPTALGTELIGNSFEVRSLAVSEDARYAYLDCVADQATDLVVELFTIDGKIQHSSSYQIQPGENRVPIALPQSAGALAVFRITTRQGLRYVRKVKL